MNRFHTSAGLQVVVTAGYRIVLYLLGAWGLVFSGLTQATDLSGKVVRVIDGDSIVLRTTSGTELEVRLTGIDAPEYDQPYGAKARRKLSGLIRSKRVTLLLSGVDRYQRILGCPILDGIDICERMIRTGSAWVYRSKTDDAGLVHAQMQAQEEQLGIWALPPEQRLPPWEWRQRVAVQPAPRGCNIKGNINSGGIRIYHLPDQKNYSKTKISRRKGERWFCSESDATAAGWRKAKR